jgi:hypothetical protein
VKATPHPVLLPSALTQLVLTVVLYGARVSKMMTRGAPGWCTYPAWSLEDGIVQPEPVCKVA